MAFTWTLTGRVEEMRAVDAAISDPDVAGVVIHGASGTGKSRLAREALSSAAARGCHTPWITGSASARALPLGALNSWITTTACDTLQLVSGVIESLTSAGGRTTVIGVDNIHFLDDLSAFVLQQIILRRAAKVVLTLSTDVETSPAAQELRNSDQLGQLCLQPLSRDDCGDLLATTLGATLDPAAAQRLWTMSGGNPLYLNNIVEHEAAQGRLIRQGRHWTWIGDPTVPPGLAEIIEARIGTLHRSVGDVVDILAVGEPIELATLARITDLSAIEEAEDRGLIALNDVEPRVEVRLAHPLYGEVRRNRGPAVRLRRLRGLVVREEAVADGHDDLRSTVKHAALMLDSDLAIDPGLLLRGAKGALSLADLRLADRLASAAIRGDGGLEARLIRAYALAWLGRGEEAETVLAELPEADLTGADAASAAFLRASVKLWTLGDPRGAKSYIDEVLHASSSPHAVLESLQTMYWAAMGRPDLARAVSRPRLQELPGIVCARTAWAITTTCGESGQCDDAVAAADAGYAGVARCYDTPQARFFIGDAQVGALTLAGRVRDSAALARRLKEQSDDLPGTAGLLGNAIAGRAALAAGRVEDAVSLLASTVDLLSGAARDNGFGYRYRLPLTIALAMRGTTAEAAASFATLENSSHPAYRHLDYERALAKGWLSAAQGAVTEAVTTIRSAAATARQRGQFAAEVACLQTSTQFGDRSTAARLLELTEVIDGPRVDIACRFATALSAGDASGLESVSAEFEAMGDVVAGADAAAHAASIYRLEGLRGSAYGSASRANTLAAECGVRTPAIVRIAGRLPLTAREHEIVMLIGEGTSSRLVAERLTLSVRTVEGHLYRAMSKTGIRSRAELAKLLSGRTPVTSSSAREACG